MQLTDSRQIGPQTVGDRLFGTDSWALGRNCPGPEILRPNCPGPNLLGAHLITTGSWQIRSWTLDSRALDIRARTFGLRGPIWLETELVWHAIRGDIRYYFADFVRKGGGEYPPKSVTPFSLKILSVKGGRGVPPKSLTLFFAKNFVDKIRKVVFDVAPKVCQLFI